MRDIDGSGWFTGLARDVGYNAIKYSAGFLAKNVFFDLKVIGQENLPETSAVLAMNHCVKSAGTIIASQVKRPIHYMVQHDEIFDGKYGGFCRFSRMIPVEYTSSGVCKAFRDARAWLKGSEDFVGIFADGNTYVNGNGGLHPEARESFDGVARIARKAQRPIVPVATWTENYLVEESNRLGRGFSEQWNFHWRNRGMPYGVGFGEPIEVGNSKDETLIDKIKVEQGKLYRNLEERFRAD